jgi:hypothetical protein
MDTDCTVGANFTSGSDDELDTDLDLYVECGPFVENDGVGVGIDDGDDCDDAVATTFPLAGDTVEGGGDTDCDGLDCVAGQGTAGTPHSGTGPYFVVCLGPPTKTNAAALTECTGATFPHDGLAEPQTAAETTALASMIASGTPWIGLTDTVTEGDFVYDSGALACDTGTGTTPYCNWATLQPDGANTDNCVTAAPDGTWADKPCTEANAYACETR